MDPREHFLVRSPTLANEWRGIILFGRNVATYKFALAKSLLELKPAGGSIVRLEDLADPFSRHLCEHLKLADKQGTSGSSKFLETCRRFNTGELSKDGLRETTVRLGFNNVIDAFHIVNQRPIERPFFIDERQSSGGILITDRFSELLEDPQATNLAPETDARWRLVETAWDLSVSRHAIAIEVDPDLQELFVPEGRTRRVSVTGCRDALNGYQKGQCFYCSRGLAVSAVDTDVDHFLPHVLKGRWRGGPIDGVWNLVLACTDCNRGPEGKFARVPTLPFLEKLYGRNEYLIGSHHPLRETLMAQTGRDLAQRRSFLNSTYQMALDTLLHTWEPVQTDPGALLGSW